MFIKNIKNIPTGKHKNVKQSINYQLSQIDKAQKCDLRMQNNIKTRFRNKYVNYGAGGSQEVGDIVSPSSSYRRDVQQQVRRWQTDETPQCCQPETIQNVVDLLFTNNEIDIDKILCLHLLGTHPCECLRPAVSGHVSGKKPYQTVSYLTREQNPVERLIERSRTRKEAAGAAAKNEGSRDRCLDDGTRLCNMLPTYVLYTKKEPNIETMPVQINRSRECLLRDGRLARRLIINDGVREIIRAVLEALSRSNPTKIHELMALAKDPEKLKEIVRKPEVQEFIDQLKEHTFLSSCESFHLSPPCQPSLSLEIVDPTESLENLMTTIRQNALHSHDSVSNSAKKKRRVSPEIGKSFGKGKTTSRFPFATKAGFLDVERLATVLNTKIREAHDKDVREYRKSLVDDIAKKKRDPEPQKEPVRRESRRSLCAACSEKWKEPLPTPKLPYLRKNKRVLDESVMKCFLSKSTYMITNMIKEEIEKMEKREREIKYAKREKKKKDIEKPKPVFRNQNNTNNEVSRKPSIFLRKSRNYPQYLGYRPQETSLLMNNLNLAKIKNQISARECDIKVKKFLDEPICVDNICIDTKLY